jgi:TonB family protein
LPAEVLVTVAVLVDEEGRAVELRVQDDSDAPALFAKAAIEAAQRSTFRPATKDGVPVKMWTTLRFRFRPR